MSKGATTLAIGSGSNVPARRIIKIIPYTEGGFGVAVPYHSGKAGFLARTPVNYNLLGEFSVRREDMVAYQASDRVKLSYHPDGFAQFSGENPGKIVSGRDSTTGEPLGLGLKTQPLSQPLTSGPSFAVTLWGLDQFDELPTGKLAEVFEDEDTYFRRCTSANANGWLLEAFVLPRRLWAGVRVRGGKHLVSFAFDAFEATRAVLEFRAIDLPGQPVFLGVMLSRGRVSFPTQSGFVLNGPGFRRPDGSGEVLVALYPAEAAGGTSGTTTLDFVRPGTADPTSG